MPLVRISLRGGKSEGYRRAIAESVRRAMVEAINVPPLYWFQVITEHSAADLICEPTCLGASRTGDVLFVQITLNAGRSGEKKRALYARIVGLLAENPGVWPQDALINLVEVPRENWSFGNGEAQYAT